MPSFFCCGRIHSNDFPFCLCSSSRQRMNCYEGSRLFPHHDFRTLISFRACALSSYNNVKPLDRTFCIQCRATKDAISATRKARRDVSKQRQHREAGNRFPQHTARKKHQRIIRASLKAVDIMQCTNRRLCTFSTGWRAKPVPT